jgi:HlyD family secretion protein
MQVRHRNTLIILLVVVAAAIVIFYLRREKPVDVIAQQVGRGKIEAIVTNTRAGTIKACRRAQMSPAVGGQIADLPVKVGDRVKQGQLLLSIWNEDLQAELQLARRQAQAEEARAQQACVSAQVASQEAARQRKLFKQGLSSTEGTERAEGDAKAKQAGCRAAKATATVSASRVEVIQANLRRTQLIAPFDGTVADINGELGEFVTPSPIGIPTPPTVDLIDLQCLYVTAPIDEVDAPRIQKEMPVRISLDAFHGRSFQGQVRSIASYVQDREKQARTVDIDVDFIPTDDLPQFLPGYSADVEIIISTQMNSLRIPTEAIIDNHYVLVFDPDSETLRKVEITTGLQNWQYTEVKSGLQAGAYVVTSLDRSGVVAGATARLEQVSNHKPQP